MKNSAPKIVTIATVAKDLANCHVFRHGYDSFISNKKFCEFEDLGTQTRFERGRLFAAFCKTESMSRIWTNSSITGHGIDLLIKALFTKAII